MSAFAPSIDDNELDSQMKAKGVPLDQRKRIIAAAKLGVPNPLKELGLAMTIPTMPAGPSTSTSRSRSPMMGRSQRSGSPSGRTLALPASGAPALPQQAAGSGGAERKSRVARVARSSGAKGSKDEDEQDLDGFLAGGRAATAAMAKAKAAERARQEQMAREQADRERRLQLQLRAQREADKKRQQEEAEREEEERRKEERRQARREEKLKKREQRKQMRAMEEDEEAADASEDEEEADDAQRHQRDQPSRKGFFSQAYKGNEEAKRLWSEPIKGQVSNHYRGFTDADLDRRFGAQRAAAASDGAKLMTEEEVLALLRKGKASKS